jgi:hypothetical protein
MYIYIIELGNASHHSHTRFINPEDTLSFNKEMLLGIKGWKSILLAINTPTGTVKIHLLL